MFQTAIMLSLMTAILLAIGFFVGGIFGMALALAIALLINFVSYWYSDRIVLRVYGAKPSDDPELLRMVGNMAREASIPKPRVYMIPSEVPNAFATGRNPKHAAVAVTEGMSVLSKEEMEAVIAHEIFHIANRDTLVQTVAATIAGAISFVAQLGYWSTIAGRHRNASSILGLLLVVIFAPIAALIVKLAISRRREYGADHGGALLSKRPLALASALRKISKIGGEKPMHASPATSHVWIVNPLKQDRFTGLFATHPPVKRRITKLERMVLK